MRGKEGVSPKPFSVLKMGYTSGLLHVRLKAAMNPNVEAVERVARMLDRAMASLEGPLERLVYLASIRDSYTGCYMHEGWTEVAGTQAVHELSCHMHRKVFDEVVRLPMAALLEQLQSHFTSLNSDHGEAATAWLQTQPFREMVPADCSSIEREFFASQMKMALAFLTSPTTPADPATPDASQRQPLGQ